MMTEAEYKQAQKEFADKLFPMTDQTAADTLELLKESLEQIMAAEYDDFDFSDEIRAIDYAVEKLRGG